MINSYLQKINHLYTVESRILKNISQRNMQLTKAALDLKINSFQLARQLVWASKENMKFIFKAKLTMTKYFSIEDAQELIFKMNFLETFSSEFIP